MQAAELAVLVLLVELEGATAAQGAAAAAGEHERQLGGIVGVAVEQAGGEQDHAVFEQGALAFLGGLHLLQRLGPDLDHELVALLVAGEALGVVGVVGELVLAALHADEPEVHVRQVVRQHVGDDAGAVHLEGQHHDVEHEPDVFLLLGGDAGGGALEPGRGHARPPAARLGLGGVELFRAGDALFQVAHGGEVLVELLAVAPAELAAQALGIAQDQIEHAFVARALAAVVEQLVEGLLGINFLGRRRRRAAPGQVGGVERGVTAVGAVLGTFGADGEAGDRRLAADAGGDDLVHGQSDLDVGRGLLDLQAREQVHLRVVPARTGDRGRIPQALEDHDLVLDRLERLQALQQVQAVRAVAGAPVVRVDAVAEEADRQAAGRLRGALDDGRAEGGNRLKPGQAEHDARAAQELAARGQGGGFQGHGGKEDTRRGGLSYRIRAGGSHAALDPATAGWTGGFAGKLHDTSGQIR